MKKFKLKHIFALLLLAIMLPSSVLAYTLKSDDNAIYLKENEVIDGNYYAFANTITIDGNINGDIFCLAQTVNINGPIQGDVICIAENININGTVGGSVRTISATSMINNKVARSVSQIGNTMNFGPNSHVLWDTMLIGRSATVEGSMNGDLHGLLESLKLDGTVGGDMKFHLSDDKGGDDINSVSFEPLTISANSQVGGNIYYTAGKSGIIDDNAQIGGEVKHSQSSYVDKSSNDMNIFGYLLSAFSGMIVALVLINLFAKPVTAIIKQMQEKMPASIGWGAVIMFLTPFILVVLLLTLIGIPLAMIVTVLWFVSLYLGKVFSGIYVGELALKRLNPDKPTSPLWSMALGIALVWLICMIPFFGWLASLLFMWWGLGGMFLVMKEYFIKNQSKNEKPEKKLA